MLGVLSRNAMRSSIKTMGNRRYYSANVSAEVPDFDFHRKADETLEYLCSRFEQIEDISHADIDDFDVTLAVFYLFFSFFCHDS